MAETRSLVEALAERTQALEKRVDELDLYKSAMVVWLTALLRRLPADDVASVMEEMDYGNLTWIRHILNDDEGKVFDSAHLEILDLIDRHVLSEFNDER